MFQLWKVSSTVLLLQAVTGLVVYEITRDAALAGVFVAFITCGVVFVAAFRVSLTVLFVALAAALATALYVMIATLMLSAFFIGFAGVFIAVHGAAVEQKKQGAKEPTPFLFLAAMPLGIGTILGGAILLARKLTAKSQKPQAI